MIGIVSRTEGEGSGAEIILCHLLASWKDTETLVIITAIDSSVARMAKAKGIRLIELPFVAYKVLQNVRLVEGALKKLKGVKLVHAWNSKSFELGWYLSKRLRVHLTCTMHDHPRSNYYTSKKLWLLKAVANSSKCMIAVSKRLELECRKHNYKCKMEVIHNALPNIRFQGDFRNAKKLAIGFLGMNSPMKGFQILSDWILESRGSGRIEWQLYGDVCEENNKLIAKMEKQGVDNIKVMGRQSPEEIFKRLDILVHASTSFDCFPTVLLEAARAGIPALASSNGGAGEIIDHKRTGFVFDPQTPDRGFRYLSTLINESGTRQWFSENARAHFLQHFRMERMVRQYREVWDREVNRDS